VSSQYRYEDILACTKKLTYCSLPHKLRSKPKNEENEETMQNSQENYWTQGSREWYLRVTASRRPNPFDRPCDLDLWPQKLTVSCPAPWPFMPICIKISSFIFIVYKFCDRRLNGRTDRLRTRPTPGSLALAEA